MNYEEFDRMLDREGNALVRRLTKRIVAQKLTIKEAAEKAASWHVMQIRRRYGGRYTPNYYQVLYTDLYETGLHDFPHLVKRMQANEPPIIPRYDKPIPLPESSTSTILQAARKTY